VSVRALTAASASKDACYGDTRLRPATLRYARTQSGFVPDAATQAFHERMKLQ